jgi:hypothetical protein
MKKQMYSLKEVILNMKQVKAILHGKMHIAMKTSLLLYITIIDLLVGDGVGITGVGEIHTTEDGIIGVGITGVGTLGDQITGDGITITVHPSMVVDSMEDIMDLGIMVATMVMAMLIITATDAHTIMDTEDHMQLLMVEETLC